MKPSKENFNLTKVKLLPLGGLTAVYQLTEAQDGDVSVTDYQVTLSRIVHPDLKDKVAQLRSIVGRVFGVTSFLSFLEGEKYPGMETARQFADGLMNAYEVRGLSWSGSGERRGIVITALFKTDNGLKTALNTPCIKLASISYGFEEELERIAGEITDEVFAYLFEGKQAQLSLFGEEKEGE